MSVVLFLVAAQGAAGVEEPPAERRDVNVFTGSQHPDRAIISTRSLAAASVLRQSSRERAALPIASLVVPPPLEALALCHPSQAIRTRPHLPFCITPRPPPLPSSL